MASIAYTRVEDLSQEITPDLQVFPAYPEPAFVPWTTREVHGFAAEALFLISRAGTHIDTPIHCWPEGHALHEAADVREAVHRLLRSGAEFARDIEDRGTGLIAYAKDPNGIWIELYDVWNS